MFLSLEVKGKVREWWTYTIYTTRDVLENTVSLPLSFSLEYSMSLSLECALSLPLEVVVSLEG